MNHLVIPILCSTSLWAAPLLPAEMCQAYMELGMTTKCLELLEVEQQKWESLPPPEKVAQEQKLIGLILTHWDALMQARRLCAPCLHWHGEGGLWPHQLPNAGFAPAMGRGIHAPPGTV